MSQIAVSSIESDIPLVVDLDGTLIKSDMLIESLFALASRHPLKAVRAILSLREGKAALKARIADDAAVKVANVPLNQELLALLREEKARGRRLYLASASDLRYVQAIADHLGLFDGVFGSDGIVNLAGPAKTAALVAAFGDGGYDYAGDSKADFAVWAKARKVLVVNAQRYVRDTARTRFSDVTEIGGRSFNPKAYIRALRCHQWLKNLLVFVPGLAAHAFGATIVSGALAFFSFSLCASSAYLLNDLADLNSDREHSTKSRRPFASGTLPLLHGVALFPVLLGLGLGLAFLLPLKFLGVLVAYYMMTIAYSFFLKRKMIVDVVVLAGLYGVRMVAGAAAGAIPMSSWLAAFAIFLFLCLALIKRCTELIDRIQAGKGDPAGRGYRLDDLPVLFSMAAASGYVSVLVMALYISSPAVVPLYRTHSLLWLICVILVYWISRVLLLTHRGWMHDDPVVFAATDRVSLIAVALVGCLVLASI